MFVKKIRNIKHLKFLLFAIGVIGFGVILLVFINRNSISEKREQIISQNHDEASISIDQVHQTAIRDGIKEWDLDADSAYYIESKKMAIFKKLTKKYT